MLRSLFPQRTFSKTFFVRRHNLLKSLVKPSLFNRIISNVASQESNLAAQSLQNLQPSVVVEKLTKSFYRRPLPPDVFDFSSKEGKQLFKEALEQGYTEGYFSLAAQFYTQSEPAYCGLATLCIVLNSLQIDPNAIWKGVWRWYSEEMLQLCSPPEVVKKKGISLIEFGCLANSNGAQVKVYSSDRSSEEEFRNIVEKATSSDVERVVVCYSRKVLGQTGDGHFSPIGAYHKNKDLVLLMDVARFKYPPHWIPLSSLFRASLEIDPDTSKSRGYLVLSSPNSHSSLERLSRILGFSFQKMSNRVWYQLKQEIEIRMPIHLPDLIARAFRCLTDSDHELLNVFSRELDKLSAIDDPLKVKIQTLLEQIERTELYGLVKEMSYSRFEFDRSRALLLCGILLSFPLENLNFLPQEFARSVEDLWKLSSDREPELNQEISRLRAAMYPENNCNQVTCYNQIKTDQRLFI